MIKIINVDDPSKFDDYVASSLVDVAYIEDTQDNIVVLSADESINLNDDEDKKWIISLIEQALYHCNELSASIIFE